MTDHHCINADRITILEGKVENVEKEQDAKQNTINLLFSKMDKVVESINELRVAQYQRPTWTITIIISMLLMVIGWLISKVF